MFFIDNMLVGKLFSFVFPLDKLEYGWYITCGVYVKNKVGRTFTPGKTAKREQFNRKYMMESCLCRMAPVAILHADMYHNPDNGHGKGKYFPSSPIRTATYFESSLDEWKMSYSDFNTEVWCVQCDGGRYGM